MNYQHFIRKDMLLCSFELFTGNLSGVLERHYMYARAKFTKNNKQSIN